MPRIARPPAPEAVNERKAIVTYLKETRRSLNSLALELGICQSTLQRFVAGRTKTVTARIKPAIKYVHNGGKECISEKGQLSDNASLRAALQRVWPGNPEATEFLEHLIEAIGPLVTKHYPPHCREGISKK